jgi:GH24 family phage-related lysozyme (muramidase)
MKPTLAEFATALLAVIEGCRLTAYKDSGGVWTIGIGHTGPDVTPGLTITPQRAAELFAKDQSPLLGMVVGRPLLAAAAYVSFGFNVGRGALAKVLAGQDTILNPVHTTDHHGVVEPGLVSRRRLESLLIALGEAA